MYTKKFTGETLDGTLKQIKRELGPNAIIIKTKTNAGPMGMMKKKSIEITAAVSEKDYIEKGQVDQAIGQENQEKFYQQDAGSISRAIEGYGQVQRPVAKAPGFGESAGASNPLEDQLEAFLSEEDSVQVELKSEVAGKVEAPKRELVQEKRPQRVAPIQPSQQPASKVNALGERNEHLERQLGQAMGKIEKMEQVLSEILEDERRIPQGVKVMERALVTLEIERKYRQKLMDKMTFEFSANDCEDEQMVLDFVLREMSQNINCSLPNFSRLRSRQSEKNEQNRNQNQYQDQPNVIFFLPTLSTGQTATICKLAASTEDSLLISFQKPDQKNDFTSTKEILAIPNKRVQSIGQMISELKKCPEGTQNIFIDFKNLYLEKDETKAAIGALKRVACNLEVLLCLSAIHSQAYNKKVINRFKSFTDGVVINFLDMCLDFGHLYNLKLGLGDVPYSLFSTGPKIPHDIELASAERLLGEMFELE